MERGHADGQPAEPLLLEPVQALGSLRTPAQVLSAVDRLRERAHLLPLGSVQRLEPLGPGWAIPRGADQHLRRYDCAFAAVLATVVDHRHLAASPSLEEGTGLNGTLRALSCLRPRRRVLFE